MAIAESSSNTGNESAWRKNLTNKNQEDSWFNFGRQSHVNVNENERVASGVSGGVLAAYGLSKGGVLGLTLAGIGIGLLYRGITGHCSMYESLGINTARKENMTSVKSGAHIKIVKSVTINAPVEQLYSFWRKFENLPRFMNHLESVVETDQMRSHWKAKAPLGYAVEWDAEIIADIPNQLISWRSVEGADVSNAGSVHFNQSTGGRGTVVKVSLNYEPPAGKIGAAIAWLFGEEPSVQVDEDLRRFKNLMESGEIPTTEGQTSGRA